MGIAIALHLLALVGLGYLCGSVPFGLLLTRAAGMGDIRGIGSGNIGATNVLRTGNRKLAAATLVLDATKGAAAVLLAGMLFSPRLALWAGLGAVLGHLYPVWLGFRGGKGMATSLGVYLAASLPVGLLCCAIWLATAKLTRRSSASSLAATGSAPLLFWLFHDSFPATLALAIAAVVFFAHRGNIARLRAGTEPRIGQGK